MDTNLKLSHVTSLTPSKQKYSNGLSGATSHHHVATEGCRWTVNLLKGHVSSSEVEVKKDEGGEEFLEVTSTNKKGMILDAVSKEKGLAYRYNL